MYTNTRYFIWNGNFDRSLKSSLKFFIFELSFRLVHWIHSGFIFSNYYYYFTNRKFLKHKTNMAAHWYCRLSSAGWMESNLSLSGILMMFESGAVSKQIAFDCSHCSHCSQIESRRNREWYLSCIFTVYQLPLASSW